MSPYYTCAATQENRSSGFPTRLDTDRPVQSQKKARSLKFLILEEEEIYYPCSENKGAGQLCSVIISFSYDAAHIIQLLSERARHA